MATTLLAWIAAISGIALVSVAILSIAASHELLCHLRDHHNETWTELGKPTIWRGVQSASSPAARYVTTRQYLTSNDPELRRKGDKARKLLYAAVATFLIFVLSFLGADAAGA
jgi:hypothetical protein